VGNKIWSGGDGQVRKGFKIFRQAALMTFLSLFLSRKKVRVERNEMQNEWKQKNSQIVRKMQ
jgi:hypothetical protein